MCMCLPECMLIPFSLPRVLGNVCRVDTLLLSKAYDLFRVGSEDPKVWLIFCVYKFPRFVRCTQPILN